MAITDMAAFSTRLVESAVWNSITFNKLNAEHSLRSHALKPDIDIRDKTVVEIAKSEAVDLLCYKRKELLSEISINYSSIKRESLLCFFPERSLAEGIVGSYCDYFIDDEDVPPWDTWIAYVPSDGIHEGVLFSTVPECMVEAVDFAINSYCYESFKWFDQL